MDSETKNPDLPDLPDLAPGEIKEQDAGPAEAEPVEAVEAQDTLGDMASDGFVFFTTALISTHALFDRDPLVEYRRHFPKLRDDQAPVAIKCDHPFFQGLGYGLLNNQLVNWDHMLYVVHRQYWEGLHRFLCGIATYDSKRYHYARVGWHHLNMIDPTALHSRRLLPDLPWIQITVFCASTYRGFAYINPAKDPPRTLPYLALKPPDLELQKEAEVLLGPPLHLEEFSQYKEAQHGQVDRGSPS
jgi:hypothetical protein